MTRRTHLSWILAALALAAGSSGCAKDPSMRLQGASVVKTDLSGVTLNVTLAVRNDNSFDVLVRDLRLEILLDRSHVLPPVAIAPNVWLASDATTQLSIPVVMPWSVVTALRQGTSPTVTYHARGAANVTASRSLSIDDTYKIDQRGAFARSELSR